MIHLEPFYTLSGKSQMAFNKEAFKHFENEFEDIFVD